MVIGFRSFSDGFAYVVLDGTQLNPTRVAEARHSIPAGVSWPEALSWVRRQLNEVLNTYVAADVCIKTIEHNARKKSVERLQIEAIIIEYLFSVRSLQCHIRVKAQIKRAIPSFGEAARYLDRLLASHSQLEELNTLDFQEATLSAFSLLSEN